ncbi:hypothetical protein ACH4RA_03410 [Streptomyces smyrnaeus]|uniref:hypothetical protein n=1 Tax=Streptomyces smyrnaeus TaxID=1387713 RepID=UPI003791155C
MRQQPLGRACPLDELGRLRAQSYPVRLQVGSHKVVLASSGHPLLEQAQWWQGPMSDRPTGGWSGHQRGDLQQVMTDLIGRSYASDT